MPRLATGAAVRRPDLGALVMEYMGKESAMSGYIAGKVMPIFPVAEQSAGYPVIPKEALMSVENTARAPRAKYNRSDWTYENGIYATAENGWEEIIDDREARLYRNAFDSEALATQRATGIILRGQEKRVADKVFNATNFAPNAVTNEWDDAANATPIDDVKTGKLSVRSACGMLPNTLIIAYSTYLNLKRCAQIVDLIKYTFPGLDINKLSLSQLAQVLDVDNIEVGGAVYNSAAKGQAAAVSDIWNGEYSMLTRVSSGLDITTPCIGRTFMWTEENQGASIVETYREESARGSVVRVRHDTNEALITSRTDAGAVQSNVSSACSYLMSNIKT